MAPKFLYSEENMKAAIDAVMNGENVSTAAKTFMVPRSTLNDKIHGRVPLERKMGPETVLTKEEELNLVKWILELSKRGYPVSRDQLLDSVAKLVSTLKRPNKFSNGRPGNKRYFSFLKRPPQISRRTCQNLTKSRADVTEIDLREWFQEVSYSFYFQPSYLGLYSIH